jgi:hypothetical protein
MRRDALLGQSKLGSGNEMRHYLKTSVPVQVPLALVRDYRVHSGRAQGIGYPWIVRFVADETCETVQHLHRAQDRIIEITRNVPAPWEAESFYYPANSTEPMFSVRVSMVESANGHKELRCVYRPIPDAEKDGELQNRYQFSCSGTVVDTFEDYAATPQQCSGR